MDQSEYKNQQRLSHCWHNSIDSHQVSKKATKFLVSVCVFSLCFAHSSLLSFLHSFKFYLSTFPYQLFTHTINKNCIFLITNLLLVVVAKYSGLIRLPQSRSHRIHDHDETMFKNADQGGSQAELSPVLETAEPVVEKKDTEVDNMGSSSVENVAAEETENEFAFIKHVEKNEEKAVDDDEEKESGFIVSEDEEEEEEGNGRSTLDDEDTHEGTNHGRLSSSTTDEELNKKFEDFIRKMKEGLRIEAQTQLIMA